MKSHRQRSFHRHDELGKNQPRPGPRLMERILAWAMIILLSCVLMLANRVHQLAKERIPNPVINLNVHRFLRIPSELQNVSVRVRANVGKGSGVIIDKKTVLTCCHIFLSCREGDTVWVDVVHGNEAMPMVARIVNLDQARDLALVRLTGESEFDKVAKISRTPGKWGVPVIAVGCPNGNFLVPTQGYFHQPTSKGDLVACLGFWGNSGGPVFDAVTGELLGILREMECPFKRGQYSAGEVYPIYLFYSVPLETIKAYLAEHKQK